MSSGSSNQIEQKVPAPILDPVTGVATPFFARRPISSYSRDLVLKHHYSLWIKEWDYYYFSDASFGCCVTIANLGYIAALSVTVLNFDKKCPSFKSKTSLSFLPLSSLRLSDNFNDDHVVEMVHSDARIRVSKEKGKSQITATFERFYDNAQSLEVDCTITDSSSESIVISRPYGGKLFYYNQKQNCMEFSGSFSSADGSIYTFDRGLATVDWGRGVWPYSLTWYWGSLQSRIVTSEGEKTFGFNIGHIHPHEDSRATENAVFFDGKTFKLNNVDIVIKGDRDGPKISERNASNLSYDLEKSKSPRFMDTWDIRDDQGLLEMTFHPLIDRFEPVDLLLIKMIPHQVFGYYSGRVCLDGKWIEFDNLLGFCEKVHNQW